MKKIIFGVLISFQAFAGDSVTMAQLAGKYKVTHPEIPAVNLITLKSDGRVVFEEKSPLGTLKCNGSAGIQDSILTSQLTCENQSSFTQEINLAGVQFRSKKFKADVYSSLYNVTLPMNFERLQK